MSARMIDFEWHRERRYRSAIEDADFARKLAGDNVVDALLRLFKVSDPERIPFRLLPKFRANLARLIQMHLKDGGAA